MCQECQEIESVCSESSFKVSEGWDRTVEYKSEEALLNSGIKEEVFGKVCMKCGEWKGFSFFSPDKREKDGYKTWCKACKNAYEKFRKSPEFVSARKLISISEVLKYCSKCFEMKSISYFYVDNRSKDGLDYMCKECRSSYEKWRKSSDFVYARPERPKVGIGEKYCPDCEKIREVSFFYKTAKNKDGYYNFCKDCARIRHDLWAAERRVIISSTDFSDITKICSICGEEKALDFFHVSFNGRYGVEAFCKSCRLDRQRIRQDKSNYISDPNSTKICGRCGILKSALDFHNCKNNKDGLYTYCKMCEMVMCKVYFEKNADAKLKRRVRSRFSQFLKNAGLDKDVSKEAALEFMGCTIGELRVYLENLFYPNSITGEEMTWDNHTNKGWHVDHIISLSSVDLTDPRQLRRVCHYSNLQPLWGKENSRKATKLPENFDKEAWLREIENGP